MIMKTVVCVALLALCCVQNSDAWFHSWTRGRHTIGVDVGGVPGVTDRWSVGVSWTYRFSVSTKCRQLASAVIKREEWGAVKPRQQRALDDKAREVLVWHTGSNTCSQGEQCGIEVAKALQQADLEAGKDDISYNFLIGQDGIIFEGRGWGVVGEHSSGKHSSSIDVGLIGDFTSTEPSQAAQDSLNGLIVCGKVMGKLKSNAGFVTGPEMAGEAFYEMLNRCGGLCIDE